MKNLINKGVNNNKNITRHCWFIIAVFLFIVPAKRLSSQVPESSTGPLFMESVWFTTDRTIYLPGEEIEFSAIVLETDTYKPSILSRILKVELIDNKGNRSIQQEFYLEDSKVSQKISIPSSFSGGWYFLRAYTNWMRNSPEAMNNFLQLKIIKPENISARLVDNNFSNKLIASVFPENENLVAGRINHCAVNIESTNGDKQEAKAVLVSSSNDTLAKFVTDKTGWGILSFTPSADDQYTVVIPGSHDAVINTIIPDTKTAAPYATFIKEDGDIKLSISNVRGNHVKLLIHSNYTQFGFHDADVNNGSAQFSIPTGILPGGIIQFTLLSGENTILFRRLYINNDPVGSQPRISINRSSLNPGFVNAEIDIDGSGPLGNQLINTIVSLEEPFDFFDLYMPGIPGWHFSYNIPVNPLALKGWLIANSYSDKVVRSFFNTDGTELLSGFENKETLVDDRESLYEFLPETRGFTITGKVIDGSGIPVPNLLISATLLSDNNLYAEYTFGSGRFHMNFPDRSRQEDIVISFTSRPHPDWKLLIEPQFDTTTLIIPKRNFILSRHEAEYIRELDVNRQLTIIFRSDEKNIDDNQLQPSSNVSFFGKPDKLILVDDFIKLTNIREVLFEVVPGVNVRKNSGSYSLNIIGNIPFPAIYSPLFLLDGIPIFDFDEFLEFPPERLLEVRQINDLYIHGNAVFAGIVSFHSVNHDLAGLDLPIKSVLLSLNLPSQSFARDFSEETKYRPNIPVLKNTLYWKSFINSDIEKFSFMANDNLGTFVSRVSGFNAKGQWVYNKKPISFGADAKEDNE